MNGQNNFLKTLSTLSVLSTFLSSSFRLFVYFVMLFQVINHGNEHYGPRSRRRPGKSRGRLRTKTNGTLQGTRHSNTVSDQQSPRSWVDTQFLFLAPTRAIGSQTYVGLAPQSLREHTRIPYSLPTQYQLLIFQTSISRQTFQNFRFYYSDQNWQSLVIFAHFIPSELLKTLSCC